MEAISRTFYGARKETLCGKIWWQVIEVKPDDTPFVGDTGYARDSKVTVYEGTQEYIEMEYTDTLPNVYEDGEV